ncbi:MAG: TlyA family RNA methyltransferase [Puniceicoccales bacterium]|jgi:23S rRNA (cytidine1920-2'-O)/16S rRNA (cytidine1409-2'-O)-methyltransferase|nr:TlyA family RNA methyltransferase [Puniceicoccales bacterium]
MASKLRADELLFESGLVESRAMAQKLILAGQVFEESGSLVDKPSRLFAATCKFHVKQPARYVSRGGEKLEGFFEVYGEPLAGKRALDIGASTGGFSDFLLQHGVATVTCVDVGRGQLHYKLRSDGRVTCMEGVNARQLSKFLPNAEPFDVAVIDLSFISLKKILEEAWGLLAVGGLLVALIKPQFEATKKEASRCKGVIGDGAVRSRVRMEIRDFILANLPNANVIAEVQSPISGADGNLEFFIGVRKIS